MVIKYIKMDTNIYCLISILNLCSYVVNSICVKKSSCITELSDVFMTHVYVEFVFACVTVRGSILKYVFTTILLCIILLTLYRVFIQLPLESKLI